MVVIFSRNRNVTSRYMFPMHSVWHTYSISTIYCTLHIPYNSAHLPVDPMALLFFFDSHARENDERRMEI